MTGNCHVFINTISGGIVNFGGAIKIAPVSITKTTTSSLPSTSGQSFSVSIPNSISGALGG